MKILVATGNAGKLKEYQELLSELAVEWVSLKDVGLGDMDVDETGSTFAENAILKAQAYHQASGLLTLADDSGLAVDALSGAPGVYSARYGSPELKNDQDRYQRVLSELEAIPMEKRGAQFICVVGIAAPNREIYTVEGVFEGKIGYEPRGTNGFGYDPIFVTADGRHVAELPSAEKHQISHRGIALRKALPYLLEIVNGSNSKSI